MNNLSYTAVIAILIAVIVVQRECNQPKSNTIVKVDTVYLTVKDTFFLDRPIPNEVTQNGKPIEITVHDTTFVHDSSFSVIKEPVDTSAILADYMKTRIYKQDFNIQYGKITIHDTVTQNKLLGVGAALSLNIPSTNTIKPAPLKNKVYLGLSIGSNGNILGFGPQALLQTKQDHLYSIGTSYLPGINGLYYQVNTLWKIHF